ncbi:MAG: hypothetical protein GBAus27B_000447 [Mycoplasmataceae bacterium]|nr:MAG: hypothetical protein GBAus27B_000447 [Mycoplasmataceae bacterium]
MICLQFSLSSSFLFLALWKNNQCLISVKEENVRQHSEKFLSRLGQSLKQINHSLKDISEVYFTSQPSGQTGLRVSLSFLSTLQFLNPQIKIYHINTLLLQAGNNNCLSLLIIDSQGNKHHLAIYQNKKCLLKDKVVSKEELEKIKTEFLELPILKDFLEIDFLTNFQKLKDDFILLDKIEEINY